MNASLITALSFALLLAVAALCREVRFRRALQQLLRRILAYWRPNADEAPSPQDAGHDPDPAGRRL